MFSQDIRRRKSSGRGPHGGISRANARASARLRTLAGSNPRPDAKSPGAMAGAHQDQGWGRGIRTPVTGTKNRGPAAGRYPNADVLLSQPV